MAAEDTLKQVLAPLIAKVKTTSIANQEVLQIVQGGRTIKIPFSTGTISSDTNTLE